jgi:hypothetical protein
MNKILELGRVSEETHGDAFINTEGGWPPCLDVCD